MKAVGWSFPKLHFLHFVDFIISVVTPTQSVPVVEDPVLEDSLLEDAVLEELSPSPFLRLVWFFSSMHPSSVQTPSSLWHV